MHIGAGLSIGSRVVAYGSIERQVDDQVSIAPFVTPHLFEDISTDMVLAEKIDDELAGVDIRREDTLRRESSNLAAREPYSCCPAVFDHNF